MAAAKFPNQNTIIIKKTPCKDNFLQVNIDEWQKAAILCGKSFNAFKLYLYLASNSVDYQLGLSQQAIENVLDIKKSSYYTSVELLKELGYLVDIGGNRYEFYTDPDRVHDVSAGTENYINDKDSAVAENSVRMEKVNKNPLSAGMENSVVAEKIEKNQDSARVENSVETENNPILFNF